MHLGVLLHWLVSAIAVGKDRDTTGWKACGSIPASLNKAPFLRFCRTLEIAESTVGGAFLHGAELSDAFVSLFSLVLLGYMCSPISEGVPALIFSRLAPRVAGRLPALDSFS